MTDADKQKRFSELFSGVERSLNGFVFSLVPNRADADDVLQETLRSLWQHYDDFDQSRPFFPWASHFAYMQVLQMRRKHAIRGKYFCDAMVELLAEERPKDAQWLTNQKTALQSCLKMLSQKDRELVELRYENNQSIKDMSNHLGQTANSFYKRLQRIRKELVECVTQRIATEGAKQ